MAMPEFVYRDFAAVLMLPNPLLTYADLTDHVYFAGAGGVIGCLETAGGAARTRKHCFATDACAGRAGSAAASDRRAT